MSYLAVSAGQATRALQTISQIDLTQLADRPIQEIALITNHTIRPTGALQTITRTRNTIKTGIKVKLFVAFPAVPRIDAGLTPTATALAGGVAGGSRVVESFNTRKAGCP